MPDVTAQAATFRSTRHRFLAYMSVLPQADIEVLTGSVSATPSSFPALTVSVTVSTGTITNVVEGDEIEFFNSGVSIGKLRIATGGGSGTTLQVSEFDAGAVNVASGNTFIVRSTLNIFDRLVSNTAAFKKDSRITYTDQNSNQSPVANAGGLWAGFVDSGQSYATVDFDASDSFVVDPDSAGTRTYLWAVGDGTITVGSTTTAAITVQFPVGYRRVKLTVTDAGNSKATVRFIPVWVHDTSGNYPISVLIENRSYTPEDGHSAQFQLPVGSEADLDNLPDGAMVVIWERNWYSTTEASYGSAISGRSHIQFVGYLDRDESQIDAENDETTFTAISPLGVLAKTPALPQLLIQDSTPNNWQQYKSLTIHRALGYLIFWHTTFFNYFDFVLPGSGDLSFSRLAAAATDNALAQFRDIADSLGYIVTCDKLGRLIVDRDPDLEDLTARGNRTKAYDFTTADMVALTIPRNHRGEAKALIFEAITDGSTTASNKSVYSRAPGNAPAHFGANVEKVTRHIVDNQADANERCGLFFAKRNGLYNGRFMPRGLRLTVRGGYDVIDPALNEFVTLTLPATTNKRGVNFANTERWLVMGADVNYDAEAGVKEIVYTLDHETFGPDGVTEIRTQAADNGLPPWNPPDIIVPGWGLPGVPINPATIGTADLLIVMTTGVALTGTFQNPEASGGPTWTTTLNAALGVSGTIMDAAVDPYSPQYLGTGTLIYIHVATTTEAGRLTWDRADNSLSYASQLTFASASDGTQLRQIETTRGVNGLVVVATDYRVKAGYTGVRTYTSLDHGVTWGSEVTVTSNSHSTGITTPGLAVGRAGVIYTSGPTASGFDPAMTGRKSTDSGASYSTVTNPLISGNNVCCIIHFPWHDNSLETIVYYCSWVFAPSPDAPTIYRAIGTSKTDVTPLDSSARRYGRLQWNRGIHTADNNRFRVGMAGHHSISASGFSAPFLSADGGDTWTQVATETSSVSKYNSIHVAENGTVYCWGTDFIGVGQWDDLIAGLGFDNRIGNLTSAAILNIIGG